MDRVTVPAYGLLVCEGGAMLRRPLLPALVLALTALSQSALAAPGPTPTPTVIPTVDPRTAAELDREVAVREQRLARQRAALAAAGARSVSALQTYQGAQRAADLAVRHARTEAARLDAAVQATARAQRHFDGYVGSFYKTGMIDPRMLMMSLAVTAKTSDGFFTGLGLAEQAADWQSRSIDGLSVAAAEQDAVTRSARDAQAAQARAVVIASRAKAQADRVLAAAARRVAEQDRLLAAARGVLAVARLREANLAAAEVLARSLARGAPVRGTCRGDDVRGFPNGQLPPSALCPVWGTAGHVLQKDAAGSFDLLSKEYARQFARPMCVTDSYRSYGEQVAVKKAKPDLAATPGHSEHGWGMAVDLCDGVERPDSVTHAWLADHAALFGWFHPAWAEPSGAKPEAWHWEYAGLS